MLVSSEYEDGVSPVIAVILMVAVTVLLSVAVGSLVFDMGQSTSEASDSGSSGVSVMRTTNSGVDSLELTVVSTESNVSYSINGDPKKSLGDVGDSTTLTAGVDYL